jgi:AraC-like DNA-binding protein
MKQHCGNWFHRLAEYIDTHSLPPIVYADVSDSGRFYNPPAEHIEVVLLMSGHHSDLKIGDLHAALHPNEVCIHNVHFGNYSPRDPSGRAWCFFIETKGIAAFDELKRGPTFASMPAANPKRLAMAFETLAIRCRLPNHIHPGYLSGTYAYDPRDARHRIPARQFAIKAALLDLLAMLIENADSHHTDASADQLQTIRLAIEFIARRYAKPSLMLSDIADAVRLSDDYFGTLFRRHVGTTPMRYLRTVRIEQSKLLLTQTRLPINEIAARVGFDDPLHFSRVFHQTTHVRPTDFRRQTQPICPPSTK